MATEIGIFVDVDGDAGGLVRPAVGHRVGEGGRAFETGGRGKGEGIAGAELDRAVANGDGRAALGDGGAVDLDDLRAALEVVGARGLVLPAHRVEGDRGAFVGADRVGDDVADGVHGDGDAG